MIDFLRLLACALTTVFRSRARLEAQILVLRHVAIMLLVAALIEGFWSPSAVIPVVKWIVSVVLALVVGAYLTFAGRDPTERARARAKSGT